MNDACYSVTYHECRTYTIIINNMVSPITWEQEEINRIYKFIIILNHKSCLQRKCYILSVIFMAGKYSIGHDNHYCHIIYGRSSELSSIYRRHEFFYVASVIISTVQTFPKCRYLCVMLYRVQRTREGDAFIPSWQITTQKLNVVWNAMFSD